MDAWPQEWPDAELDVLALVEAEAAGDLVGFGAVIRNASHGESLAIAVKLLSELARERSYDHTLPEGFRPWAAQALKRFLGVTGAWESTWLTWWPRPPCWTSSRAAGSCSSRPAGGSAAAPS
jgi:hypothetical protein